MSADPAKSAESAPIEFVFDVISPFAYVGWHLIRDIAAKRGRRVAPTPVLLAAILDHYGHKGPAEIPPKRAYTFAHIVRLAHTAGVPLAPPAAHPFNPLLALRIAGLELADDAREVAIDAVMAAAWADRVDVTDPERVAAALTAAGADGVALVDRAGRPEAKRRLREATDAAIARGVFGVPTVIADGELFWGCDALPHLDAFLAGADPFSPAIAAAWRDVPVGARRRATAPTDSDESR